MYEMQEVLARIDQHLPAVLVFTLIAWLTGFVQIFEAVRLGRRDRVPGAPAGMTLFLLAHDGSFFLRHGHWFHTVDHWYFKLFWVGMGTAVVIELVMVWQLLRYGRQALAPGMSARRFLCVYLVFQLFAFAALGWLQSWLDDPLYLVSLAATQIAAVVFNLPMLLARGDARGQSMPYAWATLLGPGSLALGLFPTLCPAFLTPLYAGVCMAMLLISLLYLTLLKQALAGMNHGLR